MSEILYVNCAQNSKVSNRKVVLGDVATLWCADNAKLSRLKCEKIYAVPAVKKGRYVMTVVDLLDIIHQVYPDLQVESIGVSEFIIDYVSQKPSKLMDWAKAVAVGLVTLVGSIYAIMAYNNDVGITELFEKVYGIFGGAPRGILEATYSVGIFLGIIIFYNHFGKFRLTADPTPMEVAMRTYEQEIDNAVIENADRGKH